MTKKMTDFFTALNALDSAVKIAITSGGIALGAGLAWFYGPAIAFTAAYNLSIWSSTAFVTPNTFTYYMFIKPAATHTALYCANSALIKGAIGMASSGLGYGLGKAGCEAYEGLKYAIGTSAPAAMKYVASTGYSAASTAVSLTGHTLSPAANTTSRLASSAWKWWSGAKAAEANVV